MLKLGDTEVHIESQEIPPLAKPNNFAEYDILKISLSSYFLVKEFNADKVRLCLIKESQTNCKTNVSDEKIFS